MRMFVRSLVAGVVALGVAAPAFADPPRHAKAYGYDRHDRDDRRDDRRDWRDDRRDDRRDWRDDRRDDRRDWRSDNRDDRYYYRNGYSDGRRDSRYWHKGDRFRPHYTRHVVVHDYHRYRVPPPRHGHYYARTDTGDLLLVAAATGLVLWALSD
jgi:Ni/Co efflux regulator RcnB